MPYAQGRKYHDADSHVMEPLEWLAGFAEPGLAETLLNGRKLEPRIQTMLAAANDRLSKAVPGAPAPEGIIAGPKGCVAFGAFDKEERHLALDELGFDRQLVFATYSLSQFRTSEDPDVLYGGARAHNKAMTQFCGSNKRLIPVGFVPLNDPERALEELKVAIELGCGAIWVPATPAGSRSPGHPDLDPFWSYMAQHRVPFMLHIGPGSRLLPDDYKNNGKPRSPDIHGGGENLRFMDFVVLPFAAQMFLAALVYDGLFDRVPDLRGGVIEFGAAWVPGFLKQIDLGYRSFSKTDPLLQSAQMKPSEYMRKHIKFTPFPGEDAGALIREAGADLFMFSSDYPHNEGTNDPIGRFERTFGQVDETEKDLFYSRNFEAMMGAF
jgi:predicted TIM-barrel fold metal-dependent hydrolase